MLRWSSLAHKKQRLLRKAATPGKQSGQSTRSAPSLSCSAREPGSLTASTGFAPVKLLGSSCACVLPAPWTIGFWFELPGLILCEMPELDKAVSRGQANVFVKVHVCARACTWMLACSGVCTHALDPSACLCVPVCFVHTCMKILACACVRTCKCASQCVYSRVCVHVCIRCMSRTWASI